MNTVSASRCRGTLFLGTLTGILRNNSLKVYEKTLAKEKQSSPNK